MKTAIIFALGCLLCALISCNSAGTANDTASNGATASTDDVNKKMIDKNEQVYRAIETGNMSDIDTIFATDVVDHTTPTGKEVKGKDSNIALLKQLHTDFKNIKIETKASSYDRDKGIIFSLVRITGTSAVDMDGLPANTPFDRTSVDVVKVTDGKITDHWGYEDLAAAMKMMNNHPATKR